MIVRRGAVALAVVATLAVVLVSMIITWRELPRDDRRRLPFAEGRPARPADDLVESIGVNTHLHYGSTAYADFRAVEQALLDLGIRHIRDYPVPASMPKFEELAERGVRLTAIMGTAAPREWMPHDLGELHDVTRALGDGVAALEGVNEWDLSDDPAWPDNLRDHQRALWKLAEAAGDRPPVLAPSITWAEQMPEIGDLSDWADAGNIHPYPGGGPPEVRVLSDLLANQRHVVGDKPVTATETGYHDAVDATADHPGVPPTVAATYVPRLFLHYFDIGVARTHLYELVDQDGTDHPESSFGLLDHDFRPKPAYHVLRRLVQAVADPGRSFEPGRLDYRIIGSDPLVHDVLLQRRDGTFVLALWRAVSVWDPDDRSALAADALPARLEVASEVAGGRVITLHPGGPTERTIQDASVIELEITPFVQLVELRPHDVSSGR